MDTQDLSQSNLDAPPDITRADQECLTTATAREVIDWLVACRAAGTLLGVSYQRTPSGDTSDGWFGPAYWLTRAMFAFKANRSEATPTEDTNISAWLLEQANYMKTMQQSQLDNYFPSRLSDDWTDLAGVAATGANIGYYLYKGGPLIPSVTLNYNNRRAACCHFLGQAGLYFNDQPLIDEAKRYVKEWVMFGVWGDGVQSEWQRNEGSTDSKQGLVYSTHNMTCALEIAARTAERGDDELATFSTTYGLWGTESTAPKTIYTALDLYVQVAQGLKKYSDPKGRPILWWSNNYGLGTAVHWHYMAHALNSLGKIDKLSAMRQVVTPAAWGEDQYFGDWRGYCGMYPSDVRVGLPDPIQARLG